MDDSNGPTDDELEPPIEALAGFLEDVPDGLPDRVRSSIQRRLLAADVADFSFNQILQVFLEFVRIIFEGLRVGGSRKGGQP